MFIIKIYKVHLSFVLFQFVCQVFFFTNIKYFLSMPKKMQIFMSKTKKSFTHIKCLQRIHMRWDVLMWKALIWGFKKI